MAMRHKTKTISSVRKAALKQNISLNTLKTSLRKRPDIVGFVAPDLTMPADLNRINRLDGELIERAFQEAISGIVNVNIL